MKPERTLVAARALARHCPELLRAPMPPEELLAGWTRAGERLAKALVPMLSPLLGSEPPEVRVDAGQPCTSSALAAEIGPLAANSLLAAGLAGAPLLVSIEARAVLRLVDRAFGGRGELRGGLPAALPLSAELLILRLEKIAIEALAAAFGLPWPDAIRPTRRDAAIVELAPFSDDEPLTVQRLTVVEAGGESWTLTLAVPLAALDTLCGDAAPAAPKDLASPTLRNPADEPLGAMPLTLSAVLVDMAMPVSALTQLAPGQVLPITVARNVPLRIGGSTIAHGTIGALDERVAVQITQAF